MKKQTSQALLPTIEQVLCACGCGQYFMAQKTPRKRLYLNNTHKKRAARNRQALQRKNGTVRLTPKGWVYWQCQDQAQLERYWREFSPFEQALIQVLCDTGKTPEELFETVYFLFGKG